MNYYTHHIGDFNNATRHLTRLERSIYRDLIDLYYETEVPLMTDLKKLCRLILATSNEEATVVERVLEEYFELTEDGWVQHRCQTEIERVQIKQNQAIEAGKASARARAKALRNKDKGTPAQRALNGRSTDAQPPNTQHPTPNKKAKRAHPRGM